MTPADLISAGACTPRCLLASPVKKCRCSCNGGTHGLLAEASIDALLSARRVGYDRLSDDDILAGVG